MTAPGKPRATRSNATKPAAVAVAASAPDGSDEICSVRIELRHSKPLIWREVEVPTGISLKVLHDVVQVAMGWLDYHLWEFTIDHRTYGLPMDDDWGMAPRRAAVKVRLREVLKPRKTTMEYLYDMGDSWEHRLIITKIRQGELGVSYPRFVAGELAAPPEDCGGIPGFYEALAARADPTHPEHAEMTEWLDDYDPNTLEVAPIQVEFDRIATRREAARKRIKKTGT